MKQYLLISLLGLLGINCSSQPTFEKASNNHTLLWQISGNGLKQPSYFFGTIHMLCAEDANISDNLQKVIQSIDQVYFEIDMDNLSQMLASLESMLMKNGKTLKDLYSEKDYEKVKQWFSKHSELPFDGVLETFKPMLLSPMVSETAMGCSQKDGMEFRIMEFTNKRKLEIKGLETLAFQAEMLDSIPYEEQAKDLLESIDSIGQQNKILKKTINEYKSQNLDSIEAFTKGEDGKTEKYLDIMLYNRNRDWVNKFTAIASEKSTLFAVGAGHLPGDKGVLQLLRKMGYTLTPIKN